ncbi:MAG: hypothetical protein LIO96_09275 [Lachnospiraceae bacterium]|nr:hypothetical protein [Lachnospiraceae bacterium]
MFELIIIIVVIAAFVFSRSSKRKAAGDARKKNDVQGKNLSSESFGAGTDTKLSHVKQAKPNQPKPGTRTAKPNKPKPGTRTAKPNTPKPEQTRRKPEQPADKNQKARYQAYKEAKQSGQSASAFAQQMYVDDILESARENTREVQIDNDMDTIEIGDLLEKVQKNIVMGPDDTLKFQRDFLAEGMDFLNRCTAMPEN